MELPDPKRSTPSAPRSSTTPTNTEFVAQRSFRSDQESGEVLTAGRFHAMGDEPCRARSPTVRLFVAGRLRPTEVSRSGARLRCASQPRHRRYRQAQGQGWGSPGGGTRHSARSGDIRW